MFILQSLMNVISGLIEVQQFTEQQVSRHDILTRRENNKNSD